MTIYRNMRALLERMGGKVARNYQSDFGWPDEITFEEFRRAYRRNSLAASGIDKTIAKTWQCVPKLHRNVEHEKSEGKLEGEIRQRFDDIGLWRAMAEADRRGMVGSYSALILRYADDLPMREPVSGVRGGLLGLVSAVPVWQDQVEVKEWIENPADENYGKPRMFQFREPGFSTSGGRTFDVHPDRVLIWSQDGTVHGRSALEPGYNDLVDAEKIKGAGGEGFWKAARSAPILRAPQGQSREDLARGMGVPPDELQEALNTRVDEFARGFDKMLALGDMEVQTLAYNMPSPDDAWRIAAQSFAASLDIPFRILVGNQTGERASTEDAVEWALTCEARRSRQVRPLIMSLVNRLEDAAVLPDYDWHLHWDDLTEPSKGEKMKRAKLMSDINAQAGVLGEIVFEADEIRREAGFDDTGGDDFDRREGE